MSTRTPIDFPDNPPRRDPLAGETSVVWLEDVSAQPYVRELLVEAATTRTGPLKYRGNGRTVGYTVLRKDAPHSHGPRMFYRRIFWLASHDPYDATDATCCPVEAVTPASVIPGVKGTHPSRVVTREVNQ